MILSVFSLFVWFVVMNPQANNDHLTTQQQQQQQITSRILEPTIVHIKLTTTIKKKKTCAMIEAMNTYPKNIQQNYLININIIHYEEPINTLHISNFIA